MLSKSISGTIFGIRIWLLLLGLTVLIASANILYLTHVAHTSPSLVASQYPAVSSDIEFEFATLTINMVDHGVFSMSTTSPIVSDALRTPGYPLFIAPFYALFRSFYPVLIAQIFTLYLTVLLVYAMARRFLDERWALALTTVYLLLPDTGLSVATLMAENIYTLVFVAALYFFFYAEVRSPYVRWAGTGVLLALMTYIRPASIYILVFFIPAYFLFYLPWREFSRKYTLAVLLMIIAFYGTLFPWNLRNHLVMHTWQFATTGAFVLFRQNATQFYEAYYHVPNLTARYILEDRAGIPHGPVPVDPKYSPVLQKVALQVVLAHPVRYALFHVTGFIPFFTGSGAHDYNWLVRAMQPAFNPPPEPSLVEALTPFSLPLLLVVLNNHGWFLLENVFWGIVVLLILIGLWRSKDVRLARMFFALMLYFAAVCGPIGHARYRIPVEPLMLMSAFSAAAYLYERRQSNFAPSAVKIAS